MLVSTQWLHDHLHDPSVQIFDCTGALGPDYRNAGYETHYLKHHISGAAYLDIASPFGPLAAEQAPLPFTWPSPDRFAASAAALGLRNDTTIVLYAGPNPAEPAAHAVGITWSTRAWWILYHYGFKVALLDGGWGKWVKEGRPVDDKVVEYPRSEPQIDRSGERGRVLAEQVLAAVNNPAVEIVDSLSPVSYRGETDRRYGDFGARRGHITSARNVHFTTVLDENFCFKSKEALEALFRNAGVSLERPVITYCGGGVGATTTGLALKLLGHDDVTIYDASMMEWAANPDLPMTNPSESAS